jgi:hypothetical protein
MFWAVLRIEMATIFVKILRKYCPFTMGEMTVFAPD